jgi:hypothetical protein
MGQAALAAPPHSNVVHGHIYSETLFTDVFIVVRPTVPEVIIDLLRGLLVHAWVFLGNFLPWALRLRFCMYISGPPP